MITRFLRCLRGKGRPEPVVEPAALSPVVRTHRAHGHIVQIGLDFGTAYMKAVCRDLVKDSAWVYQPQDATLDPPCLVPSVVSVSGGKLSRATGQPLPLVKMALRKAALEEWADPVLAPFRAAAGTADNGALFAFVQACTTFAIADTLAGIRRSVKARLQGFGEHPDDYLAVNMAIPVADAQMPTVNSAFLTVLRAAWRLSERLPADASIAVEAVTGYLELAGSSPRAEDDPCFVYPEVSANVQGFVRSRVSRPDIYLFCDVGAGTVDQSVFIYHRNDDADVLTYLDAAVLPLGSSELERRAAADSGAFDGDTIEHFRRKKERGDADRALDRAKMQLAADLHKDTKRLLLRARKKLNWSDQLTRTRVIFGGGGHTANPYGRGTLEPFGSEIFAKAIVPDTLGMPLPTDLELDETHHAWMKRLSVAYGLSFERHQLVPFIYPVDVEPPTPDQLWRPRRRGGHAPSKDEV